ncbi:hypothetical protein [Klebsiella quasipneumoniae]|uniref:hypothetical protein n=1 Tax=Klebsiella quasipneumoniae TaxID=1463165 RepID=UPI0021490C6D|nr:hypothetical protein [Klebsiella quasipneumoniae]MCR1230977.1 hypothetical protein [Klebsiella quasipneumoniae]
MNRLQQIKASYDQVECFARECGVSLSSICIGQPDIIKDSKFYDSLSPQIGHKSTLLMMSLLNDRRSHASREGVEAIARIVSRLTLAPVFDIINLSKEPIRFTMQTLPQNSIFSEDLDFLRDTFTYFQITPESIEKHINLPQGGRGKYKADLRIDLFIIKKNCHLNLATTFFEYDGAHHFIESSVRNDKYRDSSLASMGAPTFRMQHIEKKGIEKEKYKQKFNSLCEHHAKNIIENFRKKIYDHFNPTYLIYDDNGVPSQINFKLDLSFLNK